MSTTLSPSKLAKEPGLISLEWLSCGILGTGTCLRDRSWQSSSGLTASLYTYRRSATTHYSRLNNSILAISELSTAQPIRIDPQDILLVYNNTFNLAGSMGQVDTGKQLVQFLANYLEIFATGGQSLDIGLGPLKNLLVLPFVYFQPNYINPGRQPSPDTVAEGLPEELYTSASYTDAVDQLVVGRISLLVYVAVGAVVLAASVVVIIMGSLEITAGGIPNTSPWPVLDLALVHERGEGPRDIDLVQSLKDCQKAGDAVMLQKVQEIRVYTTSGTSSAVDRDDGVSA